MEVGMPNQLTGDAKLRGMLRALCEGLVDIASLDAAASIVSDAMVPDPFRQLLVHSEHMTTRLERHCGRPVTLSVLASRRDGDSYRRMILLRPKDKTGAVEFGIVRIDLRRIAADVKREILDQAAPLGEILIRHNVLRRVEPRAYLRFAPAAPFTKHFKPGLAATYGRLAVIHYDTQPAIELLEVVSGTTGD
jgi:hypothetical protein